MLREPKEIVIRLETPNFDVAVDRAIMQAEEVEPGDEPFRALRFDGLTVDIRSWYDRENLFYYKFTAK